MNIVINPMRGVNCSLPSLFPLFSMFMTMTADGVGEKAIFTFYQTSGTDESE